VSGKCDRLFLTHVLVGYSVKQNIQLISTSAIFRTMSHVLAVTEGHAY